MLLSHNTPNLQYVTKIFTVGYSFNGLILIHIADMARNVDDDAYDNHGNHGFLYCWESICYCSIHTNNMTEQKLFNWIWFSRKSLIRNVQITETQISSKYTQKKNLI